MDKFISFSYLYDDYKALPIPKSVEEIYQRVPVSHRFSSCLPEYVKSQIDENFLALLDWIYYKYFLFQISLREEIFFEQKHEKRLELFLRFLGIPLPDKVTIFSLKRLVKNSIFIWKNKNTLDAFYLYLRSLYGDFFYCKIFIDKTNKFPLYYLNYRANNPAYYTSSDIRYETSYLFTANKTSNLYTVLIEIYSELPEEDIKFIKSLVSYFIPFFQDTGDNIKIVLVK